MLSIERVNLFSPPEGANPPCIDVAGSSDHDNRMTLAPDSNAVTTTAEAARRKRGSLEKDLQDGMNFTGVSGAKVPEDDQMEDVLDSAAGADLAIGGKTEDETASPDLASMSHGEPVPLLSQDSADLPAVV